MIRYKKRFVGRIRPLLALVAWFFLWSCGNDTPQETHFEDPHSYARPAEARVSHLDLDIIVDFEAGILTGTSMLTIEKSRSARELYLDTKEMDIEAVTISSDGKDEKVAKFELGEEDSILGAPLVIQLRQNTKFVSVVYKTRPGAEALQFLPKELTAGKKHPFLLTQSQAINARTWVPTQDSPGIRFTYNATVKVPEGLMAVMSANNPTEPAPGGVFTFEMPQPIPAYLLALAVGDFVFRPVGSRTGIYAEPSVIEDAAWEFAEMEEMMEVAEELYGPYQWGRYDLIVLPASFPFGGMENPRITFATPTILAGDRSLVALVAHELAHSWSGNLVTNATWNDFWLNEGFTVYFENRIMEEVKGREYSEMLAQISFEDLEEEVSDIGFDSDDTKLAIDLVGRNPDDGMTSIAYDKGYFFLRLIEENVGRKAFDEFLRAYFADNSFRTMTTERFVEILRKDLLDNHPGAEEAIGVEGWIYGTGIPDNIPFEPSERFKLVEDQVHAWIAGISPDALSTDNWTSHEWLHFIRSLPDSVRADQLSELDNAFGFTQSKNAEVQCVWYVRSVKSEYHAADAAIRDFLVRVGRRKFLTPIYRAFIQTEEGKARALDIYQEARNNYHPIAINTIDDLLGWEENL